MHQSPEPIKDLFAAEAIDPNGGVGFGRINCRSRRERRNPVREEISCIINRRNAAWTGSAGGACGAPQELPPPAAGNRGLVHVPRTAWGPWRLGAGDALPGKRTKKITGICDKVPYCLTRKLGSGRNAGPLPCRSRCTPAATWAVSL